jgi:hypothetical protein
MKWTVDLQAVGSGEAALKSRRVSVRPPLNESQVQSWDSQNVTFRYWDNGGTTTLHRERGEFVRRVLQHVLPKGFQRVRHYGWLGVAARLRRERIAALLDCALRRVRPRRCWRRYCRAAAKTMVLIAQLARKPPLREEGGEL